MRTRQRPLNLKIWHLWGFQLMTDQKFRVFRAVSYAEGFDPPRLHQIPDHAACRKGMLKGSAGLRRVAGLVAALPLG